MQNYVAPSGIPRRAGVDTARNWTKKCPHGEGRASTRKYLVETEYCPSFRPAALEPPARGPGLWRRIRWLGELDDLTDRRV